MDAKMRKDLRVLAQFCEVYCAGRHEGAEKTVPQFKHVDVADLLGHSIVLCGDCMKLLAHALTKRCHCPLSPKPACKHCPVHCYHPEYRRRIQEVMRYSGRRLVLSGRIDYLAKLLF